MMKDVIDSGTGGSIRWRHKFKSPMAGKTGTTNNKTDAWFIGFTPQIALGVWVGVDDPSISLGKKQYGSKAALPIFADAIKGIYNLGTFYSGTDLVYIDQNSNWEMPDGVVVEKVCSETYEKATRWCTSIDEIYLDETKPSSLCKNHSGALKKKIRK
jgi:penicillin-binding protein 1A